MDRLILFDTFDMFVFAHISYSAILSFARSSIAESTRPNQETYRDFQDAKAAVKWAQEESLMTLGDASK